MSKIQILADTAETAPETAGTSEGAGAVSGIELKAFAYARAAEILMEDASSSESLEALALGEIGRLVELGTAAAVPVNDSTEAARSAYEAAKPCLDRAYALLKTFGPYPANPLNILALSDADLAELNRLKDAHRNLAFDVGTLEERLGE